MLRTTTAREGGPRSSISDSDFYPLICEAAAERNWVFWWFRSNPVYREILEHVTPQQGDAYLQLLRADEDLLASAADLVQGDRIGRPRRMAAAGIGRISPTTLRYLKVLADLRRHFGPLDGLRIAEIGVGYGGQARVTARAHSVLRYTLYDIPPVLSLAARFLEASGVAQSNLNFVDGRTPTPVAADLVISNYAFSELRREVQGQYLEAVILSSPRGYATYNHISPPELGSMSAIEFAANVPGAEILAEDPLTHPGNVIVVWGHGSTEDTPVTP